jgi:hypothetical protein
MGRHHRFRRITFLDGPRAGEWVTASIVPPGHTRFTVSTGSAKPDFVDIHEYELVDFSTAKFVRFVETKRLEHGPIQCATAPGSSARRAC